MKKLDRFETAHNLYHLTVNLATDFAECLVVEFQLHLDHLEELSDEALQLGNKPLTITLLFTCGTRKGTPYSRS